MPNTEVRLELCERQGRRPKKPGLQAITAHSLEILEVNNILNFSSGIFVNID